MFIRKLQKIIKNSITNSPETNAIKIIKRAQPRNISLMDSLNILADNAKLNLFIKRQIPDGGKIFTTAFGTKVIGEFKEIHTQKSQLPEVILFENKMKNLGYKACFADNLATAKIITETYEDLTNRGYKLPKEIALMTPQNETIGGFRPIPWSNNRRYDTPIIFNKRLSEHKFNPIIYGKVKHNSTSSPQGIIYHEIAHFLHEESKIDEALARIIWKNATNDGYDIRLENEVGHYAMTGDYLKQGEEFVAEVFAGLMEGNTYSKRVMELYDALGGPKILQAKTY